MPDASEYLSMTALGILLGTLTYGPSSLRRAKDQARRRTFREINARQTALGRGQAISLLHVHADDVAPDVHQPECELPLGIGRRGDLSFVELPVVVGVEIDGPTRQAAFALVLLAVAVGIGEEDAGDVRRLEQEAMRFA